MSASAGKMAERQETLATPMRAFGGLERIASVASYRFGQTIYFKDQRADCWYSILRGAARECAVNEDGRRQIVGGASYPPSRPASNCAALDRA
jgi:CRP-like cAMP-binding protein